MKPCDCIDLSTAKKLNEQGLRFNEWSIFIIPNSVIISNSTTELKIPMNRFRSFASWYLEDQTLNSNIEQR